MTHHKVGSDNGRRHYYARITWSVTNLPSDLAGYRVEMAGSPDGPWERVTQHPIAWWDAWAHIPNVAVETHDPGAGATFFQRMQDNLECRFFRVIAIDNDGLESDPVIATTPSTHPDQVASTTCPETPAAPTNLTAIAIDNAPIANPKCFTKLDWDAVPGAAEYHVYRLNIHRGSFFYRTQVVSGVTTHTEQGDYNYDDSDPDDDCPYAKNSSLAGGTYGDNCDMEGSIDAFYVRAKGASGGLGPRSEIVLLNCDAFNGGTGQSWLWEEEAGDAIFHAGADSGVAGSQPWPGSTVLDAGLDSADLAMCSTESELVSRGVVPRGAKSSFLTASARTLGQTSIPYTIHDLFVDHLGSTRLVVDDDGTVVSEHKYFPFGEEVQAVGGWNTHRFTGHERDGATGLDYMLARYQYSPTGRFLSVDPITGNAAEPTSWNRYAYVLANPLNFTDPKGLTARSLDGSPSRGWVDPSTGDYCKNCYRIFIDGKKDKKQERIQWEYYKENIAGSPAEAAMADKFKVSPKRLRKWYKPGRGPLVSFSSRGRNDRFATVGNRIHAGTGLLALDHESLSSKLFHEMVHVGQNFTGIYNPGMPDGIDPGIWNRALDEFYENYSGKHGIAWQPDEVWAQALEIIAREGTGYTP